MSRPCPRCSAKSKQRISRTPGALSYFGHLDSSSIDNYHNKIRIRKTEPKLCSSLQMSNVIHDRWFSQEARALIDAILVPDPKQRLTLEQMKVRGRQRNTFCKHVL